MIMSLTFEDIHLHHPLYCLVLVLTTMGYWGETRSSKIESVVAELKSHENRALLAEQSLEQLRTTHKLELSAQREKTMEVFRLAGLFRCYFL